MSEPDTRPAAAVDASSADAASTSAAAANPADPYLREAQTFPRLTPEQITRARAFGTVEDLPEGTVLFERGNRTVNFFIVLRGRIEIVEPASDNGAGSSRCMPSSSSPANWTCSTIGSSWSAAGSGPAAVKWCG